ncbi:MAG: serine hydrolase domain-containing protein [Actinomycetota bacterium]
MPRRRPATAAELGLMQGAPRFPAERSVTLANWQDPPFNRWGFQHVRDLIPTARIPRGNGAVWRLPAAERDLSDATVRAAKRIVSLERFLDETYTDAFLVLHRGRVVIERYFNGMTPDTTHLLMSVSKSVTSTVAGALIGRGALSPSDLVTTHVPELAGTSFDGCTVRHLLDMRAGTRFDEDYANVDADVRVYEQVYLWRPRTNRKLPPDATSYFTTLKNARPHGGPFEYRSILTDVLAWVIERAGGARLPELISRDVWQPMGAEFDAEVTVDARGNAMADGGVCCTLRDLARFGLVMARGGRRGSTQLVPRAWIRDILTPDDDSVAAFAGGDDARDLPPGAYYRDQWWVRSASRPTFYGSGINGQMVLIDGPTDVVVAKFSTWPEAFSDEYFVPTLTGSLDLARQIGGRRSATAAGRG